MQAQAGHWVCYQRRLDAPAVAAHPQLGDLDQDSGKAGIDRYHPTPLPLMHRVSLREKRQAFIGLRTLHLPELCRQPLSPQPPHSLRRAKWRAFPHTRRHRTHNTAIVSSAVHVHLLRDAPVIRRTQCIRGCDDFKPCFGLPFIPCRTV